ncbi:IucA/IucC family protein [Streptomyces albireticuli]|uniref:IucA/IucC family protein n=1 Tax=Streptomyces albireticuli TaxID=1940 RepID=UPI003689681D
MTDLYRAAGAPPHPRTALLEPSGTTADPAVPPPGGEPDDRGERAAELVMRDLVDTLIQENLYDVARRRSGTVPDRLAAQELRSHESWFRVDLDGGWICFRARRVTALQSWRFSRGPVWHGGPGALAPVADGTAPAQGDPARVQDGPAVQDGTSPVHDGTAPARRREPSPAVREDVSPRPVETLHPAALLGLLQDDSLSRPPVPGHTPAHYTDQVLEDLRTAVEHTAVTLAVRRRLVTPPEPAAGTARTPGTATGGRAGAGTPSPGEPSGVTSGHPLLPRPHCLVAGERLASLRNRPFHPTARAATGWSAADATSYGPLRDQALPLAWVAVPRQDSRHGSADASGALHHLLLTGSETDTLLELMARHRLDEATHQPLPVHPWQYHHLFADGHRQTVDGPVPLTAALGAFHPTSSLRTLAGATRPHVHVKLPLNVTTLGVPRLLVPGDLDNGELAEATLRAIADRDPLLRDLALVCDERTWAGWSSPSTAKPPTAVLPGQLAAQVRLYPRGVFDAPHQLVMPMAALAAHEWDLLGPALARARSAGPWGPARALEFFGELADSFLTMAVGYLRHGVLPELHGQNVVVVLENGRPSRFVLRDHDTLRFTPGWMADAGLPLPGYRIKPGDPDSVCVPTGRELVGFLQTLGVQVNLYGVADALARAHGIDESLFWKRLPEAVETALARTGPPSAVTDTVRRELLRAPVWPSRLVLGPLLREGRSRQVTMPAGVGQVPNPLLPPA